MIYFAIAISFIISLVLTIFIVSIFEDKIRERFKLNMQYLITRVAEDISTSELNFRIDQDELQPIIVFRPNNKEELLRYKSYVRKIYDPFNFNTRLHLLLLKAQVIFDYVCIWGIPIVVGLYAVVMKSWLAPISLVVFGILLGLFKIIYSYIVEFLTGFHMHHSDLTYRTTVESEENLE